MLNEKDIHDCRILAVDDNPANLVFLARLLEQRGFVNVRTVQNPTHVLQIFQEWNPELMILDLHMPEMDGYQVITQIKEHMAADSFTPILVFTADATAQARRKALETGASDFLTKPGDAVEIVLRVQNFLRMKVLYEAVANSNLMLEEKVAERTREIEAAYIEMTQRLATAAEYRDDDTGQHAQRVGDVAGQIGVALGFDAKYTETLRLAATLHDLGKIGIPDSILLKPGKLTPEEFEQMKEHTIKGAKVLAQGESILVRMAEQIAISHHENWDGTGYPKGLSGEDIPIVGRIVAVADVFDALTSVRPYKSAMSLEEAIADIKKLNGTKFDPKVVEAFLSVIEAHGENLAKAA